jgi:hypothetical protein
MGGASPKAVCGDGAWGEFLSTHTHTHTHTHTPQIVANSIILEHKIIIIIII